MTEEAKEPLSENAGSNDKMNDIDDILAADDGGDFFEEAAEKNPDKVEEPTPAVEKIPEPKEEEIEEIPSLRGEGFPADYKGMVERVQWQYRMLPRLDYDAIYSEIAELSVKACPTPTLQVLNDEIQKVQGAKDRLSELFIDILKCYNFKKRAVDILKDSWGRFTTEKNTEARKGDSAFRLSNFMLDFASNEALLKSCMHVLKNLDSLHDSLSRRITIYQLTMKLHDVGRTALPDFDFDRPSDIPHGEINDLFGDNDNDNDGESNDDDDSTGKPQLRKF